MFAQKVDSRRVRLLQHDRPWNTITQLSSQTGQVATIHDDCRFKPPSRSQLKRPLLALGELDGIASRPQQASNSRAQLCVLRYN